MLFAGLRLIFCLTLFCLGNSLFALGDYSGSGSYLEPYKPLYPSDTYEKLDMYGYEYGPKNPRPSIVAAPEPKSWSKSFFDFFGWNRAVERPVFGPTEPEILTMVQNDLFSQWQVYGLELPKDKAGRVHSFVSIDARNGGSCHLYGSWLNKPQISGKGFRRVGVVSHIKVISGQVTVKSVDSDRKRKPIDRVTPVTLRAGEFRLLSDILSNQISQYSSVKRSKRPPCSCRGIVNFLGTRPLDKPLSLSPCGSNCLKYKACPDGHFGRDRYFVNKCRVCDYWFNDVTEDLKLPPVGFDRNQLRGLPLKPPVPSKRTQIEHVLPKPTFHAVKAQMANQSERSKAKPSQYRRPSQIGVSQSTMIKKEPQRRPVSQPQQPKSQQSEDFFDWSTRKINSGMDAVIDFFS